MSTKIDKTKTKLIETYTDDDGFVWNDEGDIIGIPKWLEEEAENARKEIEKKYYSGELHVKH